MSKLTTAIATLGVVAGLGVAALPLSSYAVTSDPTEVGVKATVADGIAIAVDATVDSETSLPTVDLGNVTAGGAVVSKSTTATVTGNITGYNVTIKAGAAGPALKGTTNDANTIPAGTPVKNSSFWGYKVTKGTGAGDVSTDITADTYQAVKNGVTEIYRSGSALGDDGDTFNLTFGVSAAANLPADTYTGTVILTAQSNA